VPVALQSTSKQLLPQQLRQLGDIHRNPLRLIVRRVELLIVTVPL
jgi:hypothetical protein